MSQPYKPPFHFPKPLSLACICKDWSKILCSFITVLRFYHALKICAIYIRCLWILAWCWVISEIWHCLDSKIAHRVKSSQYWAYKFFGWALINFPLICGLKKTGETKRYQKSNLFASRTALFFQRKRKKRCPPQLFASVVHIGSKYQGPGWLLMLCSYKEMQN